MKLYRGCLLFALGVDLLLLMGIWIQREVEQVPNQIWVYEGEEPKIELAVPLTIEKEETVETWGNTADGKTREYELQIQLLGMFTLKAVKVKEVESLEVMAYGEPVGIYVETSGLLVLSTTEVECRGDIMKSPSNKILQKGDYILEIDGEKVKTIREFNTQVQKAKKEKVILKIRRNELESEVAIKPVLAKDGSYKLGVWVREDTQGIGTITYVDSEGNFGALGHGITDADTGNRMDLKGGELYQTEILGIMKGKSGYPGEIEGTVNMQAENKIGQITKNTPLGIFGKIDDFSILPKKKEYYPVAFRQDIKKGTAYIFTNIEGEAKKYKICIEDVDCSREDNKGITLRIVDEHLLGITGGVIQGMSGAPIVQDGKLIGAVTHVFVDDPTRGYGIFIEEMLEDN